MIEVKKSNRELRNFGLVMAGALAVIGALTFWRGQNLWAVLWGLAGLFLVGGLVWPRGLAPVEWLWMKVAHYMGQFMTRVILILTFYLIMTPLGLLKRLFGKDTLNLKFEKSGSTYWTPVDPKGPSSRPDKPY
jgi:hypothetical protein